MENKIFDLLKYIESNGYEAFVVGGYVRDKLLNIESKDIDICTNAKPEELKKMIPNIKYKNFYCSYLQLDDFNIEITSYRTDRNYDGRKPLCIEYTNKLEDDLRRRDFTINTICMNSSGNYIDLLGGIEDLKKKIIRCVGNSYIKLKEDNLRILRAIRFASILDFKLDYELEQSIINNKDLVSTLSSYRIKIELDKILKNINFAYGIKMLKSFNLDQYLKLEFPDNVKYCDNLIGMYSQINVKRDDFFNKKDLNKINNIKKYLNKNIDLYDLYNLGESNIKILQEILNENLIDKYYKLPIKKEMELNVSYEEVKNLVNKNIPFSQLKEEIILQIINGNLNNTNKDILEYINNKY